MKFIPALITGVLIGVGIYLMFFVDRSKTYNHCAAVCMETYYIPWLKGETRDTDEEVSLQIFGCAAMCEEKFPTTD